MGSKHPHDVKVRGKNNVTGNGNVVGKGNNVVQGGIHGNGNAVGDNSRSYSDNRQYITNVQQGEKKTTGGDGVGVEGVIGLGLLAIASIAVAAWAFAMFAPLVFGVLDLTLMLSVGLILLAAFAGWILDGSNAWIAQRLGAFALLLLVALGTYWSQTTYLDALSDWAARSQGWQQFFCLLKPAFQEMAVLHAFSVSALATPSAVLLAIYVLGSWCGCLYFSTGWIWTARLANTFGGTSSLWTAGALSFLFLLSQTNLAASLWHDAYIGKIYHNFIARDGQLCKSQFR
jgi:hypothetical protein